MSPIKYPEHVNRDDDFECNFWLDPKADGGASGLVEEVA